MKKVIFTGSGVALVTPFNPDMSVNYEALERLIEYQIENGTDAIITCGTTGEAATLSGEEHTKVIDFTIKKVNGPAPAATTHGLPSSFPRRRKRSAQTASCSSRRTTTRPRSAG